MRGRLTGWVPRALPHPHHPTPPVPEALSDVYHIFITCLTLEGLRVTTVVLSSNGAISSFLANPTKVPLFTALRLKKRYPSTSFYCMPHIK